MQAAALIHMWSNRNKWARATARVIRLVLCRRPAYSAGKHKRNTSTQTTVKLTWAGASRRVSDTPAGGRRDEPIITGRVLPPHTGALCHPH